MNKRSVLNKQSVKKRKKRKAGKRPRGSLRMRNVIPLLLKISGSCAVVTGISLSLIFLYHYVLTTPLLKLKQVEIAGVNEQIRNELMAMCDLSPEQNLLFLNLNVLKKRLEQHPWIKSVQLRRRFPHTLCIRAEKHRPLALVIRNGIYYIDRECEVFKKVTPSDDIDFPVITGLSSRAQKAREQLHRAVRVINVLESQDKPWSLKNLSEIHIQEESLSLYFTHIPAAIIVQCNRMSDKMADLKKLARHLRRTGRIQRVTAINLNYVDGAVVSFRNG